MTLTNFPPDPLLDLPAWVGQRAASFRFERVDFVSGDFLGELHPIRTASMTHDTTRTIKRQLSLALGVRDTAAINPISERVDVFMVFGNGQEFPLGRFMYTNANRQKFSSGKMSTLTLNDEMFRVDQPILSGIDGVGKPAVTVIETALKLIPGIDVTIEGTSGGTIVNSSFALGSFLGQALNTLAIAGGYFSPWFGNDKKLHFIEVFDPADQIPDFDWDTSNVVMQGSIVETDNLLTAPNRFIVVSNNATDASAAVVGTYDVPNSAPNSIANRGFIIASISDFQAQDQGAAQIVARNIGIRQTVFETVTMHTAPDPRHDSYNVIKWNNALWLELAWTMQLVEGGTMGHTLRKSYAP